MEIEEGTPMFKQDRRLKRGEGGFMQRRAVDRAREFTEENFYPLIICGETTTALNVYIHTLLGNLMLKYSTRPSTLCISMRWLRSVLWCYTGLCVYSSIKLDLYNNKPPRLFWYTHKKKTKYLTYFVFSKLFWKEIKSRHTRTHRGQKMGFQSSRVIGWHRL
jgi:hypothetical protein